MRLPRRCRVNNLQIEVAQQLSPFKLAYLPKTGTQPSQGRNRESYLDKHFIQLNQRHVPPQALPPPIPKHQLQGSLPFADRLHTFAAPLARSKPPLRPEEIRIIPPDGTVSKDAERRVANLRPWGDVQAAVGVSVGGNVLGHEACDGREDAQAFFDACLQVGEAAGLGVGENSACVGRGRGDFGEEFGVHAGVGYDVEERGADGCCGCVGAGEAGCC